MQSIRYESLFEIFTRMPYKVVVPDFRLAAADGLEAGEEANIHCSSASLRSKPLTRSAPAGSAAPSRSRASAHGGCLRLRPFAFFLKALRFFHRGVKLVVQLGLACGPVTHDPADTAGQHGDRGEQGNARGNHHPPASSHPPPRGARA